MSVGVPPVVLTVTASLQLTVSVTTWPVPRLPLPLVIPGPDGTIEETVDATGYDANTFGQNSGASYREILDLSDWDKSMAVNVPGQSGQPGSKHYSDLLPLWTEGQYFPLAYSPDAVKKATTDELGCGPGRYRRVRDVQKRHRRPRSMGMVTAPFQTGGAIWGGNAPFSSARR